MDEYDRYTLEDEIEYMLDLHELASSLLEKIKERQETLDRIKYDN